jgi:MYXO-CTERM domain-containing protein
MTKRLVSLLLFLSALVCLSGPAYAAPIVSVGSVYSFYLQGATSGNPVYLPGTFDGAPTLFTRAGLDLVLSESETSLGNGESRIIVTLSSNGELFPVEGETAVFGLGVDGDVLDLLPVTLDQAILRFLATNGDVIVDFGDILPSVGASDPWNGAFPSIGNTFSIDGVGGFNVAGIQLEFLVSAPGEPPSGQVPEPGSLLLGAIALLALASVRMRRRRG